MRLPTISEAVSSYLATVAKRWAEANVYDKAARTDLGRQLRSLDPKAKYAVEAALAYVGGLVHSNLPQNSALAGFFGSIVEDAPAELSKRLINGARSELASMAPAAAKPGERAALDALLELDDASLIQLLRWLKQHRTDRSQDVVEKLDALARETESDGVSASPGRSARRKNDDEQEPAAGTSGLDARMSDWADTIAGYRQERRRRKR